MKRPDAPPTPSAELVPDELVCVVGLLKDGTRYRVVSGAVPSGSIRAMKRGEATNIGIAAGHLSEAMHGLVMAVKT